ncbi:glycoside hydrolase family 79 protein [Hydnomerulius pinastri MD-312]|uniref:Glycoside hydrolase family 79 protein n=1 Tax=Hydnomerulius pinastri MD-312 TaxID=994086 RepID=A0A0C9WDZ8_9AGAM|nr:glycoside hydrolase family 79 protein [Hydnomerulius pinastri MD-312]
MGRLLPLLSLLLTVSHVFAVTVYNQVPLADQTNTASSATYTGAAAYDPTVLNPPPVPVGFVTQVSLNLQATSNNVQGLSPPLRGSFLGFSIEFSVINQVSDSFLQVPFLNLMSNIRERAGEVRIRVGGNTQETATLVDSLPGGVMMAKAAVDTNNPTQTPAILYTPEVLYLLGNISALVGVKWFLGIPFNDTTNLRLGIAEVGEAVLSGPGYLLGFQVGNEPDLYAAHGHRPATYSPYDYFGEFGVLVNAISADTSIPVKNNLVAPSVSGTWSPEDVFNTGLVPAYTSSLGFLSVEHYPTDNCYAEYGIGTPVSPQDIFPTYLTHNASLALVAPYLNASAYSASQGKQFVMMETNTASCGGFPGVSDSFGAAMWGVDYALQMGVGGFWGGMMHVGGQDVYYNPFTPPPTNQSSYHQWTIGAVYYSSLFIAEALGPTGSAQLVDLTNAITSNGGPVSTAEYTPVYGVYENGQMARLVAFNYVSDGSGASAVSFSFTVQGGNVGSVQVKYLQAPSVADKYNTTWAGQTFGGTFASDGRPTGSLSIQTIPCDTTSSTCTVPLPAPCIALIFLTPTAFSESNPSTIQTFATTAYTKTVNTATINPSVLATSNGMNGAERGTVASTSNEGGAAGVRVVMGWGAVIGAIAMGALGVWW